MKVNAIAFFIISSSLQISSLGWTGYSRPSRTMLMMASKGALKWEKKQAWLKKRGFDAYGEDNSAKNEPSFTVIGGGRIGSLLANDSDSLLGRGDNIEKDGEGPILVCTRNEALEGIVESCPENRKKDLVFMQNGYLDNFLESKNLLENTQVLLYLSVPSKGAEPVDGITALNPEGLTAATGIHAEVFKDRLSSLGLKCNVVSMDDYRPAMFEKLIWISTYMLVGAAKECKSVGQAGSEHKDLVEKVIEELVSAVTAKEGIKFAQGTVPRLASYTDVVTDFPAAVKEFEWRNKYFYDLGDDNCPTHNQLLKDCAEKGILGFDLP